LPFWEAAPCRRLPNGAAPNGFGEEAPKIPLGEDERNWLFTAQK